MRLHYPKHHKAAPDVPWQAKARRNAVWWVQGHRIFKRPVDSGFLSEFEDLVAPALVYVDPNLGVENIDNPERNIHPQVVIEPHILLDLSPDHPPPPEGWNPYNKWTPALDWRLTSRADTLEEALVRLSIKVNWYYGDGQTTPDFPKQCTTCVEFDEQCYCTVCGYHMDE